MGCLVAPNGPSSAPTALRVTAGPAVGELILVDDELRLGSSQPGVGALGGDASLSAAHALLTRDHIGEWMVHDLGSAEGTFLNGRPLSGIEPLHRGDTLRLGSSKLLVLTFFLGSSYKRLSRA
jgi:pSer/pThr/pTyr-binding forkhead associated (FHA) protein